MKNVNEMLIEKQETSNNVVYLTVAGGSLVQRVDEGSDGAKPRLNKKGVTVFEKTWASVAGKISNVSLEDNIFGEKQIRVGLKMGSNVAVITIKYDSSYGRDFLKQIFNVDLSRNVVIAPWQKKFEDKTASKLYMKYGVDREAESVKNEYPSGTPTIEWIEQKGKPSVIDTRTKIAFDEFIEGLLNKFIDDNNLRYVKPTENEFLDEEVVAPLSKEEKQQLTSIKKNVKKNKVEEDDFDSLDDFFKE